MASKKSSSAAPTPSAADAYSEYGATGLKQYSGYVREEWLRDLIGRKGLLMLREMRDNDPIIGAMFFAVEMMLRGVPFHIEPEDGENPDDVEAADFIESCMGDMEQSWTGLLAEFLTFLLYGWDVHEIVYKMRKGTSDDPKFNSKYDDGMIGWRKFAPRSQDTLLHWIFDEAGDATHLVQLLPTGGPLLQVPLEKCLHLRTTPNKSNPEGRSIIRNAYTSYYYKKTIQEIEAIGVSRDLTGLTCVWVPPKWTLKNATADDKAAFAAAKVLARDIARNQQEGLVVPMIMDEKDRQVFDIKLLSTGGRRQFATNDIISRYDHNIAATMLADFITLGTGVGRSQGTGAQSKNKSDIFSIAVVAFLDLITSEFSRKAIVDLLAMNNLRGQCSLAHGDIQRRDLGDIGTYLLDAATAGVLTPDSGLEAYVREEAGLPPPSDDEMDDDETDGTGETNTDDDPAGTPSDKPGQAQGGGGDSNGRMLSEKRAIQKAAKARAVKKRRVL